ncbi:hypothetical protein Acr_04g0001970 [Actinidia rufa]|uniref:Uncharacterized protein n=1 Tax=Actinidia rufa TaxID=165716 RepID=A0A7J0EHS8_9ERIC|nr:hypothetical protein Acr_04g0001970 [Actinidia rufa]
MELNRAQRLMHDVDDLAQFRIDHDIPRDVLIERPGPNKDVCMHSAGTWKLNLSPHVANPPSWTLFSHQSNAKGSYSALATYLYESVSGNWEFQARNDGVWSFPRHNGNIPDMAAELKRETSFGSNDSSSLELLGSSEDEVEQVPGENLVVVDHVLVINSDKEELSNLKVEMPPKMKQFQGALTQKKFKAPILDLAPTFEVPALDLAPPTLIKQSSHSFPRSKKYKGKAANVGISCKRKRGGKASSTGASSNPTVTPKPWVVMLPQDVVDIAAEDEMVTESLMVMQYVQISMANLEHLKKHSAELKKAQKKANTLETELKKTKKELIYANALSPRSASPLPC